MAGRLSPEEAGPGGRGYGTRRLAAPKAKLSIQASFARHDPADAQWAISLAYATRRAQSIEAAKCILLEAVERLPDEPILHFNLACYECQLGELEVAKARLAHAFKLEPKCRLMALDDDDLAPLWDSLAG